MSNYIFDLIGKICIPLIIGYVTFIIAKKQIVNAGVTQFRQKWIDNLRDSISIFIAKAEMISMLDFEDNEAYFIHFKELSQMQYKVELMLNASESDHKEISTFMWEIRDLIHDEDINEKDLEFALDDTTEKLVNASKRVLKREWGVVKKGG